MRYLLDTDICVYWLKGNEEIEKNVVLKGLEEISICFITLSELFYGAFKSSRINENINNIFQLESKLSVVESNPVICEKFGKLKAGLEKEGKTISDADLFIAACAVANNLTLVTNNTKHFHRVKELKVENWIKP
jgi:tRNA(fMet)-specific endonuclease VapC